MLPTAPPNYSAGEEAQNRASIQRELDRKIERGVDIEMGEARVILTSPNGTRYALSVSDAGALSAVAV